MRFPAAILATIIAAFALGYFLTVPANPEVQFWVEAVKRREAAATAIREQDPNQPIIFFTGGSSTAFSIHPSIIEEHCGTPAINLGLPVSSGAKYILHQALRQARAGDLIVICLEPDLLTNADQEASPAKTGFGIEAMRGTPAESAGGSTFDETPTIPDYLTLPRPGASYLLILAGRSITGAGYRYKTMDIGYRGIIRTDVHDAHMQASGPSQSTSLHPEGRQLLESFAAAAKKQGVRLAYSMPWRFTATDTLDHNRTNNRQILADIAPIIPVIDDGFTGAIDGIENFSDSPQHLSDTGTATRSHALARALKAEIGDRRWKIKKFGD